MLASKIFRSQLHSTIPSGTFVLEYTNPGVVKTSTSVVVPFNANSQQMQNIFQNTISPDINVSYIIPEINDTKSFNIVISLGLCQYFSVSE